MTDENNLSNKSDRSINDASLDSLSEIKSLRLRNINKVIIGNINIKVFPDKFERLKELVMKYNALVITETKLDNSFPTSQFLEKDFAEPFRLDRNRNGGGIMIYIRDDIPRTLLLKHIFQVTLKVYSYNSILGNANGCNLEHNIPPSQSE